jgi:hypothetical protein
MKNIILDKIIKTLPLYNKMFNHQTAKKYELRYAKEWTEENFERLYPEITNQAIQKDFSPSDFFHDKKKWAAFSHHITGKTVLEIGSGPAGAIIRWYWCKKRVIIDPLIDDYKKISLQMFHKTWSTDDIILYARNAEDFINDLDNTIDGAIVCRNALDHCEQPYTILNNISKYATKGCQLLLWTDLYHPEGHDEGHTNITDSKKEFIRNIKTLGFTIHQEFSDTTRPTLNYGCIGSKI